MYIILLPQPTPHAGLIAGVFIPKLFFKICLFVFNDKHIHQYNEQGTQDQTPIGSEYKGKADQETNEAQINRISRKAIRSTGDDFSHRTMRIKGRMGFHELMYSAERQYQSDQDKHIAGPFKHHRKAKWQWQE